MIRFFYTIDQIELFIRSLQWQTNFSFSCPHCARTDQWFSHGFQYKQLGIHSRAITGKRLICSNRFGHLGCGRTWRLYLCERTPFAHYGCTQFFAFILALFFNTSTRNTVEHAYRLATGANNARHAWRWLNRLRLQLPAYRAVFFDRPAQLDTNTLDAKSTGDNDIHFLIQTTLSQLFQRLPSSADTHNLCALFQLKTQIRFI